MKTLTCTLKNASEEINGIKFSRQDDGSVVAEVADEVAEAFAQIPGYSVADVGEKESSATEQTQSTAPPDADATQQADAPAEATVAVVGKAGKSK